MCKKKLFLQAKKSLQGARGSWETKCVRLLHRNNRCFDHSLSTENLHMKVPAECHSDKNVFVCVWDLEDNRKHPRMHAHVCLGETFTLGFFQGNFAYFNKTYTGENRGGGENNEQNNSNSAESIELH
jgi:hypothetical protein